MTSVTLAAIGSESAGAGFSAFTIHYQIGRVLEEARLWEDGDSFGGRAPCRVALRIGAYINSVRASTARSIRPPRLMRLWRSCKSWWQFHTRVPPESVVCVEPKTSTPPYRCCTASRAVFSLLSDITLPVQRFLRMSSPAWQCVNGWLRTALQQPSGRGARPSARPPRPITPVPSRMTS